MGDLDRISFSVRRLMMAQRDGTLGAKSTWFVTWGRRCQPFVPAKLPGVVFLAMVAGCGPHTHKDAAPFGYAREVRTESPSFDLIRVCLIRLPTQSTVTFA